jgi:hypothetical protein
MKSGICCACERKTTKKHVIKTERGEFNCFMHDKCFDSYNEQIKSEEYIDSIKSCNEEMIDWRKE